MRARPKVTRLFAILLFATAASIVLVAPASAYVLTLEGRVETPMALYVGAPGGHQLKIVEIGASAPGGGTISDLGIPALAPDGSVIFGAEVQSPDGTSWRILRADPAAREGVRIESALGGSATTPRCRPVLGTDPRVVAGAGRSIVFVANDEHGASALFRYAQGQLDCELRAGDRTAEGHTIANLGFGSAQPGENNTTVLRAILKPTRDASGPRDKKNAILVVAPGSAAREIAVEGNRSKDGARYGANFGLPTIAEVEGNTLIAFTNSRAGHGGLFVGRPNQLLSMLSTGVTTQVGKLTYLSDGRPGLSDDGSVAIRAASGDRSFILSVRAGEPFVVSRDGNLLPDGERLEALSDPIRATPALVYVEAAQGERNGAYTFSMGSLAAGATGATTLLSNGIEVFPSSLVANRSGRYAFLSGAPRGHPW